MASPNIDLRLFPLVLIRVPAFVEVDEIPPFYASLDRIGKDRGEHVAILDFRDFDPLFAAGPVRRVAAEQMRSYVSSYAKWLRAEARVVDHAVTRAMTSAFHWLAPVPWPMTMVATPANAERWVRLEASRAGLVIPSGRVDLDAVGR